MKIEKMDRQLYFNEAPSVVDWGKTKIVPLNINEALEGELTGYRADIIRKVETPITVDSILDAAIDSEYTDAELKYIMRNITDSSNNDVIKYQEFVKYVKESAIAAGYSESE